MVLCVRSDWENEPALSELQDRPFRVSASSYSYLLHSFDEEILNFIILKQSGKFSVDF